DAAEEHGAALLCPHPGAALRPSRRLGGKPNGRLRASPARACKCRLGLARLLSPSAALCPRLPRHSCLPRFAVQRVPTAPAAVLVELDAVRRVPLGLLRLVVATLAVRASERDCD